MRALLFVSLLLVLPCPVRADLGGAAASHVDRAGPLVAWSQDVLHVSRDDGAHFESMASPVPGVRRVVVESSGALVVLGGTAGGEETRLARVHADGRVEPIDAPDWISTIVSSGDRVVTLMPYEAAFGVSTRGGPLVVHSLPPTFDRRDCGADEPDADPAMLAECLAQRAVASDASLAIDRDGTAHVVDVEVNTCGSSDILEWARRMTLRTDGTTTSARMQLAASDLVYPTRWTAAPRGWVYAIGSDGRLAARALGRVRSVVGPAGEAQLGGGPAFVESNGAITVGQVGGSLVRLEGLRARVLTQLPPDAGLADVDARGRMLAVSSSALFRWSRRGGWSQVL